MPQINRRNILKTIAVASSVGSVPLVVNALGKALTTQGVANGQELKSLPLYVDVKLGQSHGKQQTEIVNHGNMPLTIKGFNPASFKSVNGQVKVTVKTRSLPYTLQPGESMQVFAEAVSSNSGHSVPVVPTIASERIAIRTQDLAINGELMVSVFDCQA